MRQRNVKNREEILAGCAPWAVGDPAAWKGRWSLRFARQGPIFLEIGSGKGQFIVALAQTHLQANYIAVEGGVNIAVRILEKARAGALDNLLVIPRYAEDPGEWFGPGEVAGLYLNFSDPWPKPGHAARRLTHRLRLRAYSRISAPEATLTLKTDNEALFEFSLEEFRAAGLPVLAQTRDLYASDLAADNISTEYEDKFSGAGKAICYAKAALHPIPEK